MRVVPNLPLSERWRARDVVPMPKTGKDCGNQWVLGEPELGRGLWSYRWEKYGRFLDLA